MNLDKRIAAIYLPKGKTMPRAPETIRIEMRATLADLREYKDRFTKKEQYRDASTKYTNLVLELELREYLEHIVDVAYSATS